MKPRHSKAHQTYLEVVGQLKNKCAGCDSLMDHNNCCVIEMSRLNIREFKMYHLGCQPKKIIEPKEDVKKKLSVSEKLDIVIKYII